MPSLLPALLAALTLAGSGVVDDDEGTTLPISHTAGLSTLQATQQELFATPDAGIIWVPDAEDASVALPADGGPGDTRPDAGSPRSAARAAPAACKPIADEIAHRRTFMAGVARKSNEVGWAHAAQAYCAVHGDDVECSRPPTAVDVDIDDDILDDSNTPPETDAWLVRWTRDLQACEKRETERAAGRQ